MFERSNKMRKKTVLLISIFILLSPILTSCAETDPPAQLAYPPSNEFGLTEERLQELAASPLGSVMMGLHYATDERIILHNGFGILVYDFETSSIYRSLDLGFLDVPTDVQGEFPLGIAVDETGNEIFIGSNDPERTGRYVFHVETAEVQRLEGEWNANPFAGLRRDLELSFEGGGWNSSNHVITESGALIILRYVPGGDGTINNIQIIRRDGDNETAYAIFP